MDIYHSIKRLVESAFEHIDNNFEPVDDAQRKEFNGLGNEIITFLNKCSEAIANDVNDFTEYANEGRSIIRRITEIRHNEMKHIRDTSASKKVDLVYITLLQESQNIIAYSIHLLNINAKFQHS